MSQNMFEGLLIMGLPLLVAFLLHLATRKRDGSSGGGGDICG